MASRRSSVNFAVAAHFGPPNATVPVAVFHFPRAKLSAPFFKDRKREAKRLYQETQLEKRPRVILEAYERRTGLTCIKDA